MSKELYDLVTYIAIGGLVSIAIDETNELLFISSLQGRGIVSLKDGKRISRDNTVVYPEEGKIMGIHPMTGIINVIEYDYQNDLVLYSESRKYRITGESSGVKIEKIAV